MGGRGERDIWILDLARLSFARLSDGPTEDLLAVWSTDGTRLSIPRTGTAISTSIAAGRRGGARPGRVFRSGRPDGQRDHPGRIPVLVQENFGQKATLLDLARRDHSVSLFEDRFDDRLFQISRDGKWVVYESNESGGAPEIAFCGRFPIPPATGFRISSGGGRYPKWGPKGSNELYYVTADGSMMAVSSRWRRT